MSFVVKVNPKKAYATNVPAGTLGDWGSFLWGFVAGGIAVTVLGGVVLYFTWPYIISMMKTVPLFGAAVEEAKARGLI